MDERVYAALRSDTAAALAAGYAVIADAVFARPGERETIRRTAEEVGIPFRGLWLDAPADVLLERVGGRRGDASDTTAEIVHRQLGYVLGPIDWHRLDASRSPDANVEQSRFRLAQFGWRMTAVAGTGSTGRGRPRAGVPPARPGRWEP